MRLLSQSQYARRKGVHRSRITHLVKAGVIPLIDGRIDPTIADANWERSIDPVRRDNLKTSKPVRHQKMKSEAISPNGPSFVEVKRDHELLKKELTALGLKIKQGELVPRNQTVDWLCSIVIEAKMAFLGLPRRLGEPLALISDPKEIEFELSKEIRSILFEMAKPLPEEQRETALKDGEEDARFEEVKG